ncbi:hypothetical protein [Morganella psychrotolerans]|uniref:Uncharacterized protein n=1 Tax=Morganella psychrotolerans TaxID=368603 RepID=A0A1B8HEF3_9GAMM|nr:hypothetical protein [Morganella psychrotolerans]OBU07422.1 hypothetical protein AYY17_05360 [Morganella psychrotolerans]
MCNISNNKKDNKNKKINPKIIKGIIVLILIISFGAVFDFNLVKINTKSLLGVDSVTVSTKNNQHSNSTNNGSNIISEVVNITNNSIGNTVGDGFDNKNKNKDMGDVYGEGKALISSKDNYNGSVSLGGNRKIKLTDDSVFF